MQRSNFLERNIVLYILKETAATPLTPQPPRRKRGSKKRNKNSEMNSIYRGQKGINVWNKDLIKLILLSPRKSHGFRKRRSISGTDDKELFDTIFFYIL